MPNEKWNSNNNNIIIIINIWTCMHSQVPWHTFPASLLLFNLTKIGKLDKDSYYSRKPKPSKLKWHVCGDTEVMAELWVKAATTFLFDYYRKAVVFEVPDLYPLLNESCNVWCGHRVEYYPAIKNQIMYQCEQKQARHRKKTTTCSEFLCVHVLPLTLKWYLNMYKLSLQSK